MALAAACFLGRGALCREVGSEELQELLAGETGLLEDRVEIPFGDVTGVVGNRDAEMEERLVAELNVATCCVVNEKTCSQKRSNNFTCFESRELRRHGSETNGDFLLDRLTQNLFRLWQRLTVFQQPFEMAPKGVGSHGLGFLKGLPESDDFGHGGEDDAVATFLVRLEVSSVAILWHVITSYMKHC